MWATLIDNEWFVSNTLKANGAIYVDAFLRGIAEDERIEKGIYAYREEPYDNTVYRCTGYTKALVDNEVVATPILVEIPQEELTRIADSKARMEAKATLSALDLVIPRGVEDLITTLAVDVTTLPQIQQDRLTAKAAARAVIQATNYLDARE